MAKSVWTLDHLISNIPFQNHVQQHGVDPQLYQPPLSWKWNFWEGNMCTCSVKREFMRPGTFEDVGPEDLAHNQRSSPSQVRALGSLETV